MSSASVQDFLSGPHQPVLDDLTLVLSRLLQSSPSEPLRNFERLVEEAKNTQENQQNLARESDAVKSRLSSAVSDQLSLLGFKAKKVLKDDEEEDEEAEEPAEIPAFVPCLSEEFYHFRQAGISFPPEEVSNLQLNLEYLATHEPVDSIRFWGKIFHQQGDYFLIEAKMSEYPEFEPQLDDAGEELESRVEPWGTGPNEFLYFVNRSLVRPTEWTKLPLLTPEQIVASAGSRRFLTGDLSAPVYGFPRFPGFEASYLRALIGRISHATVAAPLGKFLGDEEDHSIALENEEFRGLSPKELLSASNWVHSRLHLLREGRTEHFIEAEKEDEKAEAERLKDQKEREAEAVKAALRPLSEDENSNNPGEPAWAIKSSAALETGYKPLKQSSKELEDGEFNSSHVRSSHVTVSAHSLIWPGAVTVACGKFSQSLYVGWGLKALSAPYRPSGPPAMREDFNEILLEENDPTEKPKPAEGEEEEQEEEEENQEKQDENDED